MCIYKFLYNFITTNLRKLFYTEFSTHIKMVNESNTDTEVKLISFTTLNYSKLTIIQTL